MLNDKITSQTKELDQRDVPRLPFALCVYVFFFVLNVVGVLNDWFFALIKLRRFLMNRANPNPASPVMDFSIHIFHKIWAFICKTGS